MKRYDCFMDMVLMELQHTRQDRIKPSQLLHAEFPLERSRGTINIHSCLCNLQQNITPIHSLSFITSYDKNIFLPKHVSFVNKNDKKLFIGQSSNHLYRVWLDPLSFSTSNDLHLNNCNKVLTGPGCFIHAIGLYLANQVSVVYTVVLKYQDEYYAATVADCTFIYDMYQPILSCFSFQMIEKLYVFLYWLKRECHIHHGRINMYEVYYNANTNDIVMLDYFTSCLLHNSTRMISELFISYMNQLPFDKSFSLFHSNTITHDTHS